MKKPLAFLLGITENLGFAAGNVALALSRHMKRRDYQVVVLARTLNSRDRDALCKIENVVIRDFLFPEGFEEIVLERLPDGSRFKERNHLMCFSHFEAFRLLEEYQNVVWLDVDISVQEALDNIVDFGPFAISGDEPWSVGDNFVGSIPGYEMGKPGVCTAVMLVNEALPHRELLEWCYSKSEEFAEHLKNPDQAIINLAIQEFSIDVKLLPLAEWQCISWREEAIDARIVHFGTSKKVWNSTNIRSAFPEWYRVHKAWLALGGRDFISDGSITRNALPSLDYGDELTARVGRQEDLQWRWSFHRISIISVKLIGRQLLRIRILGLRFSVQLNPKQ